MADNIKTSQTGIQVLGSITPQIKTSQTGSQVLYDPNCIKTTQNIVQVLGSESSSLKTTQNIVQVLGSEISNLKTTQNIVQVLVEPVPTSVLSLNELTQIETDNIEGNIKPTELFSQCEVQDQTYITSVTGQVENITYGTEDLLFVSDSSGQIETIAGQDDNIIKSNNINSQLEKDDTTPSLSILNVDNQIEVKLLDDLLVATNQDLQLEIVEAYIINYSRSYYRTFPEYKSNRYFQSQLDKRKYPIQLYNIIENKIYVDPYIKNSNYILQVELET